MKIGIDISQLAYPNTGVATYLKNLVDHLIQQDKENEYILFFSSLRKTIQNSEFLPAGKQGRIQNSNIVIKKYKFPPTLLDLLWNKLHVFPIEWLIGPVDVFISSDWTQPPTRAKKVTILYDLIVYKYPEETHNVWRLSFKNLLISPNIVASQKRRLHWVKKEIDKILCISDATKKDAQDILNISPEKIRVVYPGL